MVEPLITATRLKSTPNATANATLAFVEALLKADERKLHAQVLLDGEFCDIRGVCGAPILLTANGWRVASHEPLTLHEQHRLRAAAAATHYVFDLALRASAGAGQIDSQSSAAVTLDGHPWMPSTASMQQNRPDGFA